MLKVAVLLVRCGLEGGARCRDLTGKVGRWSRFEGSAQLHLMYMHMDG